MTIQGQSDICCNRFLCFLKHFVRFRILCCMVQYIEIIVGSSLYCGLHFQCDSVTRIIDGPVHVGDPLPTKKTSGLVLKGTFRLSYFGFKIVMLVYICARLISTPVSLMRHFQKSLSSTTYAQLPHMHLLDLYQTSFVKMVSTAAE